ncbi:MAG: TlpA family protein disulfide reductase, partial [Oligoflexus sp.]|nr:TlpA family protein disulfide reductase [Pseudopedobacter sp.]
MKTSIKYLLFSVFAAIILNSCDKPSNKLQVGTWRGALATESGAEIPFNFDVVDSAGKYYIEIINSSERLKVDEITHLDDSIHIKLPLFDSEINGTLVDGKINGTWTKHLANKDAQMTFYAQSDVSWRIKERAEKPNVDVSGRWETTFISADKTDTTKAVGEFVQNQSKVTGTFLTTTG